MGPAAEAAEQDDLSSLKSNAAACCATSLIGYQAVYSSINLVNLSVDLAIPGQTESALRSLRPNDPVYHAEMRSAKSAE